MAMTKVIRLSNRCAPVIEVIWCTIGPLEHLLLIPVIQPQPYIRRIAEDIKGARLLIVNMRLTDWLTLLYVGIAAKQSKKFKNNHLHFAF